MVIRVKNKSVEFRVPSGRPARAQQFAISVNSNSLDLANKFCVFCGFCVKLESHPGGRTGAATCKIRVISCPFVGDS